MKNKIKIYDKGKSKFYSNKEGLVILREANQKEKFRIAICKDTKEKVVQVKINKNKGWLCLHD